MKTQDILSNVLEYVRDIYEQSSNEAYGITPEEIYECYVEECEDEEVELSFGIDEIEDCLQQLENEEINTCPRCFGGGCNYCLMCSY